MRERLRLLDIKQAELARRIGVHGSVVSYLLSDASRHSSLVPAIERELGMSAPQATAMVAPPPQQPPPVVESHGLGQAAAASLVSSMSRRRELARIAEELSPDELQEVLEHAERLASAARRFRHVFNDRWSEILDRLFPPSAPPWSSSEPPPPTPAARLLSDQVMIAIGEAIVAVFSVTKSGQTVRGTPLSSEDQAELRQALNRCHIAVQALDANRASEAAVQTAVRALRELYRACGHAGVAIQPPSHEVFRRYMAELPE